MRGCRIILPILLFPAIATAQVASPPKLTHNQFSDWVFNHNAGWKAVGLNKLDRAEYCFKKAIEVARVEVDTDPRLMARSYGDLAWVLHLQGRDAEAEPLARWAFAVREKTFGAESMPVAQTMYTLATIERELGHLDEAEALLARTLAATRKKLGASAIGTADAMDDLATVLRERRRYDKARELYTKALAIFAAADPEHRGQVVPLDGLATIEAAEGMLGEAEAHLDRIGTLIGKGSTFDSAFAARILVRKAEIYRKTGRADQAAKAEADARSLLEDSRPAATAPSRRPPGDSWTLPLSGAGPPARSASRMRRRDARFRGSRQPPGMACRPETPASRPTSPRSRAAR